MIFKHEKDTKFQKVWKSVYKFMFPTDYCEHDWERIEQIRDYIDYSGFNVRVYRCKCRKCGAEEILKYY